MHKTAIEASSFIALTLKHEAVLQTTSTKQILQMNFNHVYDMKVLQSWAQDIGVEWLLAQQNYRRQKTVRINNMQEPQGKAFKYTLSYRKEVSQTILLPNLRSLGKQLGHSWSDNEKSYSISPMKVSDVRIPALWKESNVVYLF